MPRRLGGRVAIRLTITLVGVVGGGLASGAATAAATSQMTLSSDSVHVGDAVGAGAFSGVASADAYRVRYAITNFLIIEDFVDGGGPSSQAALDSLGESTAFSSFPYPGATGASLLGVASTLTGKSLPSYPFIVTSQYPSNPERDVQQPGYRLHAQSGATSSSAFTNAGIQDTNGNEIGGFSRSSVVSASGGVTSHAEATTHLKLNLLHLSGATAVAEVTRDAKGRITRKSSLTIAGLTLGGVSIGVTDQGLVLGTTVVPLNAAGAVTQAISRNGVVVKYLPAEQTSDSQMSAGLQITLSEPMPNSSGATQVITVTIGRAYAQGDASSFAEGSFPINFPPGGIGPGGSADVPSIVGSTAPAVTPTTGGLTPVTAALPPSLPDSGNPNGSVLADVGGPLPRLSFYPILALGGLVVLITSYAVRRPMPVR